MWIESIPESPYVQYVQMEMDAQFYSLEHILMCFMADRVGLSRLSVATPVVYLPAENNL